MFVQYVLHILLHDNPNKHEELFRRSAYIIYGIMGTTCCMKTYSNK